MAKVVYHPLIVEVDCLFKDGRIGIEDNRCAIGPVGLALILEWHSGMATLKFNPIEASFAHHLSHETAGQRIHHARAHTVQTRRHLVATATKLTTSVQHRQHGLERAEASLGVLVHRDTAPVVRHHQATIGQDTYIDARGIAGNRFINGVISNLLDQMVHAIIARATDIHPRALTDWLETLEHLNLRTVIRSIIYLFVHSFPSLLGHSGYITRTLLYHNRRISENNRGGESDLNHKNSPSLYQLHPHHFIRWSMR